MYNPFEFNTSFPFIHLKSPNWGKLATYLIPGAVVWMTLFLTYGYGTIVSLFAGLVMSAIIGEAFGMYYCRKHCIDNSQSPNWETIIKWSSMFSIICGVYCIIFVGARNIYPSAVGPVKIGCMVALSPVGVIIIAIIIAVALPSLLTRSDLCKKT